jgi:hypothetical protein
MTTALDEVREAYADRDMLVQRLHHQQALLPGVIRKARDEGHPWAVIASAAGVSEVAVQNAYGRSVPA